ncbi:hypothetical protein EAF00_002418 [Botryotinia globosa]|nr:hypothetical protein EAF00_002418 [Botryotinia globosa]
MHIDDKNINDPPSAVLKPRFLVTAEKTLGYVVPAINEVLLEHIADKKSHVLKSGVLSPTVFVILPTNALATEVGSGDVILECHGAYGEIPWIEQQKARVSEYPHILVATPGRLLHMMRVKMVDFDNLG